LIEASVCRKSEIDVPPPSYVLRPFPLITP